MNSNNPRTAYKHLLIELRKLKRVHGATILSYQRTIEYIQNQLRIQEIDGKTKIAVLIAGEEYIVESSPFAILKRLPEMYPSILRESLFVRAISQFETFLVDMVWEISKRTKEPFKEQNKLSYPQALLLSFQSIDELHNDIIQNECRQLTSRGFAYIAKYYKSRFGIDFSDAPMGILNIREMHERRHLFVHQLGIIDERYRQMFAPELTVGEHLKISEEYFQEAIDKLIQLAEFISMTVDSKWPHQSDAYEMMDKDLVLEWINSDVYQHVKTNSGKKSYLAYWFRAVFETDNDLEVHLNPDFSFRADNDLHSLSEILLAWKKVASDEAEWIIGGAKELAGPYISNQTYLSRHNRFVEFQHRKLKK